MKPSDFLNHPYSSRIGKMEAEIVARNIMIILSEEDKFKKLTWEEYKAKRIETVKIF